MKVAVLGCSGGMGSSFARYFISEGHRVVGHDVRKSRRATKGLALARSNSEAVDGADAVLVAVPMEETAMVVEEVSASLKRGSTLMEMTSVKGSIPEVLRGMLTPRGVSLLSIHPLFGPSARVEGSKLCVVGGAREFSKARSIFPRSRLMRMSEAAHDEMMAFTLSLVHALNLAFVSTLADGVGVEAFEEVAPPIGSSQLRLAKAVLSQSPSLLAHIQSDNPAVGEALSMLIGKLDVLRKAAAAKDVEGLEERFSVQSGAFTGDELRGALAAVYRAIDT